MNLPPISPAVAERLEALTLGDHLCLFYDRVVDQLAITAEYLRQGLLRRERCVFVGDIGRLEQTRQALGDAAIEVSVATARGALVLLTPEEAYLRGGRFDVDGMVSMLRAEVDRTVQSGYRGLRAAGDMSWLQANAPGSGDAVAYEAMMTQFYQTTPAVGLCLYDRSRLNADIVDGALRTHPTALTPDACCAVNPFYETLEMFHGTLDPQERLEWRLARLFGPTPGTKRPGPRAS